MWKPRRPVLTGLGVVAVVLVLAAAWVPMPYYSEGPGPAQNVLPRITFTDKTRYEPTGQLDHGTVDSVLAAFVALTETGVAVVAATHDPAVADRADQVIHLRDGQVTP